MINPLAFPEEKMINPLAFPEEKFTKDGERYYYTRGDGTPITAGNPLSFLRLHPTINKVWSKFDKPDSTDWTPRDLAFPLNVPYGGKREGNLSDWAFTSWLVNTAPSQIGAFGKGVQAAKGKYFYRPPVQVKKPPINVTPKNKPNYNNIVNQAFERPPNKYLSSVVTGMVTKDDPVALGVQEFTPGSILGMDGQPYALEIRRRKNESIEDFNTRDLDDRFKKIGLVDKDSIFSLKHMLDSKTTSRYFRRVIKMLISNPDFSLRSFKEDRERKIGPFQEGIEFLDIPESKLESHHIASLRQTAQLFEGLTRGEFPEMVKLLYDNGLFTGNDPRNLVIMTEKAHRTEKNHPKIYAVHTYLNEKLGQYNEHITGDWGVEIRDLSPQERIPYIKEFASVVKGSIPVLERALFAELDIIAEKKDPLAKQAFDLDIKDVDWDNVDVDYVKSKIDDYIKLQMTQPNYEALMDSIFGNESAGETMRRRGIKPGQPVQNQLFDLGKTKPPRKKPKITKKDNEYPSGSGAYWDIDSE